MDNQISRLNALAAKHGVPPVSYGMDPGEFIQKSLDIMLVALGLSGPFRVAKPKSKQPGPKGNG